VLGRLKQFYYKTQLTYFAAGSHWRLLVAALSLAALAAILLPPSSEAQVAPQPSMLSLSPSLPLQGGGHVQIKYDGPPAAPFISGRPSLNVMLEPGISWGDGKLKLNLWKIDPNHQITFHFDTDRLNGGEVIIGNRASFPIQNRQATVPARLLYGSGWEIEIKDPQGQTVFKTFTAVTYAPPSLKITIPTPPSGSGASGSAPNSSGPGKKGGGGGAAEVPITKGPPQSLFDWADQLIQLGIAATVIAAGVFIVIGAYFYFISSGNPRQAETGKDYIAQAITGLVLALVAWLLLETLSPQFVAPPEPTLRGGS
jgi:hypothetical protein